MPPGQWRRLWWAVALVLTVASVGTSAALYNGVTPGPAELAAICGPYTVPTPTFDCNGFSNATGYFSCSGAPWQCMCMPSAPYSFQPQPVYIPCLYNYQVLPCTGPEEARYFCGDKALSCTKRCDVNGNCYVANICDCAPGYAMSTNQQYCSYTYQADYCLVAPDTGINTRPVTACGVFATQAYYLCPNNSANYDPNLCRPGCNCQEGAGLTPGSDTDCDGIDVGCNAADVAAACGPAYRACTKRCQYTNANPSTLNKCVVLPGSCVLTNATSGVNGVFPCSVADSLALCGPATQSCTQTKVTGAVVSTTCTCTATGVPSFAGTIPCDEWNAYTQAPYSQCNATCGATGYINGTAYPCQNRRYITPAPGLIPAPSSFTNTEKQVYWLTTVGAGLGGLVLFNPLTVSYEDQAISVVRAAAAGNNLNTYLYMLQCTCDSAPLLAAFQAFTVLQLSIASQADDLDGDLRDAGPGYQAAQYVVDYPPTLGSQTPLPIILQLGGMRSTFVLYPEDTTAIIGNFYQATTCAGPAIAATAAIALNNNAQPIAYPITNPLVVQQFTQQGSQSYQLCGRTGLPIPAICQGGCAPLSGTITPAFDAVGILTQTLSPNVPGAGWVMTYSNVDPLGTPYSFACPNNNNIDAQFGLLRSGIDIGLPTGQLPYAAIPYADASFLYGNPWYSQQVCSGFGTIIPFPSDGASVNNLRANMGFPLIDALEKSYLYSTLQVNFTTFTVVPVSQLSIAQPGITATSYGPIGVNSYIGLGCNCGVPGWGGFICGSNTLCTYCIYGNDVEPALQCQDAVAASSACLNTVATFVPLGPNPSNIPNQNPFRYDLYYYGYKRNATLMYLNSVTCPYGPSAPECNRINYNRLIAEFCGNAVPRFTSTGVICDCKPGWTYYQGQTWMGCTIATGTNGMVNSPYCNSFEYRPRPVNCTCGGHGQIDEFTGRCICDIDWRDVSGNGQCITPNVCPPCTGVSGHIVGCNKTTSGAVNICAPADEGGLWTGECCNVAPAVTNCTHGAFIGGEWVYKFNGTALTPLNYSDSPFPGYNPSGGVCQCQGGRNEWTGPSCAQSTCPSYNGVVCSGRGNCINGQCMQNGACADPSYFGCGCQLDLVSGCLGELSEPICEQRGTCGAALTQDLTLQCSCDLGYGGPYCGTSACGATDCNAAEQAGFCVYNATSATFGCVCRTVDPNICRVGELGCLWGGPTCDIDVTTGCAYRFGGVNADLCNQQGYCNVTGYPAVAPQCVCQNGWTAPNNFCTTQPCSPQCGAHGICTTPFGAPPVCQCLNHWSPKDGGAPCTLNDCIYGYPNDTLGICQCNNTAYSYSSNCTQLSCNANNGVTCGQVNCALTSMVSCRSAPSGCRAGCTVGQDVNTCFNGTCTCHWSSMFDPVLGYCVSRCAAWPQTSRINSVNVGGQPVFQSCECASNSGLDPAFGCKVPLCRNGGVYRTDTNPPSCACALGWTGPNCDQEYCGGHGIFNNGTTNDCSCFFPWTGTMCQQNFCGPHGSPVVNPQTAPIGKCLCQVAYIGMRCELDQCAPHGHANADGSACVCDLGYGGSHCQIFGCLEPNRIYNDTLCGCVRGRYGPACEYLSCGPAGTYVNGSCNGNATAVYCPGGFTGGTCVCGGVSTMVNGNCTGNTCGAFGLPTTNLGSCICNPISVFRSQLDSGHSFNCVPDCQNGGTYNNTVPIGCNCPPGTSKPICTLIPIPSSSSSSSTGGHHNASSSSSTGTIINASPGTAAPALRLVIALLTITLLLLTLTPA